MPINLNAATDDQIDRQAVKEMAYDKSKHARDLPPLYMHHKLFYYMAGKTGFLSMYPW